MDSCTSRVLHRAPTSQKLTTVAVLLALLRLSHLLLLHAFASLRSTPIYTVTESVGRNGYTRTEVPQGCETIWWSRSTRGGRSSQHSPIQSAALQQRNCLLACCQHNGAHSARGSRSRVLLWNAGRCDVCPICCTPTHAYVAHTHTVHFSTLRPVIFLYPHL